MVGRLRQLLSWIQSNAHIALYYAGAGKKKTESENLRTSIRSSRRKPGSASKNTVMLGMRQCNPPAGNRNRKYTDSPLQGSCMREPRFV